MAINLDSVQAPTTKKVRVRFSAPVKQTLGASDSALTIENYRITGNKLVRVASAAVVDIFTVELTLDSLRDFLEYDQTYTMNVYNIVSTTGDTLGTSTDTFEVLPFVVKITSPSINYIEVLFSNDLFLNADLLTLDNYTSSLELKSVSLTGPRTLRFKTADQNSNTKYTFGVTAGQDLLAASADLYHVWNEASVSVTSTRYSLQYDYIASSLRVYVNGLRMEESVDYTETASNEITFSSAPSGAIFIDYVLLGGSVADYVYNETPSGLINGSNTVYTLANSIHSTKNAIYHNGVRLELGVDYTKTAANQVTLTSAPVSGSLIADYEKA